MRNKTEIIESLNLLKRSAALYYDGDIPLMSDKEYDSLVADLRNLVTDDPELLLLSESLLNNVGFGSDSGSTKHAQKMLSLDNVFNEKDLMKWADSRKTSTFAVEPKLDGLSLALTYHEGELIRIVTRGDGVQGENVSHVVDRINNIPKNLTENLSIEVRGEIVFTKENYEKANNARVDSSKSPYSNPRNAAAGAVRAENLDYEVILSFYAHSAHGLAKETHSKLMNYLKSLGFDVCLDKGIVANNVGELASEILRINEKRWDFDYEIDGAVIKIDDIKTQDGLGETSKAPRWAIAYKYEAPEVYGILAKIDNQVGRLGTITPVGKLAKPVEISGVKIDSITLHNFKEIKRKDLRIGDTVIVRRAGEVIPEIVGSVLELRPSDSVSYAPPTACPTCGGELDTSGVKYKCLSNACRVTQYLEYVGSRTILDIQGLGTVNAKKLVEIGLVSKLPDLYKLNRSDLLSLSNFGDKSAQNLLNEIEKSKTLPLSRFIAALGLPLIGRTVGRKLEENFENVPSLVNCTREDLLKIQGIGSEIADEVMRNQKYIKETLLELQDLGCPMLTKNQESTLGSKLDKKTFVITGVFPGHTRDSLKNYIEQNGGLAKDSVSSKIDYVLIGDSPSSSKVKKSQDLNIKTLTLDQLRNMVEV